MWGYEVLVSGTGVSSGGKKDLIAKRSYTTTCGISENSKTPLAINLVLPSAANLSDRDAVENLLNTDLIDTGVGDNPFTPHNYYYDLWWATCANIYQRFSHKVLDYVRQH